MNILITGVGPHNKGAELMLLAILDQLRQRHPEANPVIYPNSGPFDWRARLGLFQLFDPIRTGRLGWVYKRLMHKDHRKRLGLILPGEIDVVLDASGYAYGDAWKPEWVESAARQLKRYRRSGARIVLLPQAMGPFKKPRIRAAAVAILECSDLVFARDSESLAFCNEIAPQHPAIHKAPDFTNLLDGALPNDWSTEGEYVALVPNRKMLTHASKEFADKYIPFMVQVVRSVSSSGYEPFVLVHEQQDVELAYNIAKCSDVACRIIHEQDPLRIKGILGRCAFTVGSRFHGLVSALSQGVPSIGTAWSHKYGRLFQDYGVENLLCPPDVEDQRFARAMAQMLNSDARSSVAKDLVAVAPSLKDQAKRCWAMVSSECEKSRKMC